MDSISEIRSNVFKLCNKIALIANQLDVKVVPFTESVKIDFEKSSPAECLRVYEVLNQYFTLLHKVFHNNKIRNSKELFIYVLGEMELNVSSEFIDSIQENSVVEIYNLKGLQIFRNFEMFKQSNYTLLEMVNLQWFELFERDQEITDEILMRAREVLSDVNSSHQPWLIGDHLLKEKKSEEKEAFIIQMGLVAPVTKRDGELLGFASTLIAKKHKQAAVA